MRKATEEEIEKIINSFIYRDDKGAAKKNKYILITEYCEGKTWGDVQKDFNKNISNNEYIDSFGSTGDGFLYAIVKKEKIRAKQCKK